VTRAPAFLSADLRVAGQGGALPRRRVGRAALLSLALHVAAGVSLIVIALSDLAPVPPPPLTIRFFALPPPPPRLVPLREAHATPPKTLPMPKPPAIPALMVVAPEPVRPATPPVQVEPEAPPIRIADLAPSVEIHDAAPPAPAAPALAPLGAHTTPQIGTGEVPDLVLLRPGDDRSRSAGGGVAGRDLAPMPATGDPLGGIRRGGSGGSGGPGGSGGAGALGSEGAFTGAGLASYLGRKYGVTLTEASRLGSRTSDGARYSLLVPALSDAYRSMTFHGRRLGAAGDPVESVQVDAQAIAIRYRDGTVHVLVPTADGLVALYVSATPNGGRSKVQEAERALDALQRVQRAGMRG
jgi:hypothetical protein